MSVHTNQLGQPIGAPLPDWKPVASPPRTPIEGQFCRIEPINVERHGSDLFEAFSADPEDRVWTFLGYGPFANEADFKAWITRDCFGDDPLYHAIIDAATGKAIGMASFLRIDPRNGVIEIGNINYSPALQRTPAATEAMYLFMRRVFSELGYRRYEWKCDSHNAPSRRTAQRLGFTYDGLFEQAVVYKGRNRDTTWFSILDRDWPAIDKAYQTWLGADNFDADGQQRASLGDLIKATRTS